MKEETTAKLKNFRKNLTKIKKIITLRKILTLSSNWLLYGVGEQNKFMFKIILSKLNSTQNNKYNKKKENFKHNNFPFGTF